jgi:hypothetical protein
VKLKVLIVALASVAFLIPCAARGEMVADIQVNAFDKTAAENAKDSIVILRGSSHKEVKIPQNMAWLLVKDNKVQATRAGEYLRRSGSVTQGPDDFVVLVGEGKVQAVNRFVHDGGLFLYHSPGMTLSFFNEAVPGLQQMNNRMAEKVQREGTEPPSSQPPGGTEGKGLAEINAKLDEIKGELETVMLGFKILLACVAGLAAVVIWLLIRSGRSWRPATYPDGGRRGPSRRAI